jgi:hypothetical protein
MRAKAAETVEGQARATHGWLHTGDISVTG